jgi:hypothetical protein
MIERFVRSWELVKASAGVLAQDRELLMFPLIASLAAIAIVAAFVLPLLGLGAFDGLDRGTGGNGEILLLVLGVAFCVVEYFVMIFFQSALVGAAMIRLRGGDPTLGDGLRIAWSRLGAILGYALIAATIGILLRSAQERSGMIGRWVAGLIGVAWTVATYLVVPVLVTRDVGPLEAVRESARLLQRSWGENVIGQGGIGLVCGALQFLLVLAGGLATAIAPVDRGVAPIAITITLTAIAVILVALVQTALSGIYAAALYRHAIGEQPAPGFDQRMLAGAFVPK